MKLKKIGIGIGVVFLILIILGVIGSIIFTQTGKVVEKTKYVCSDGTTVDDPSLCPKTATTLREVTTTSPSQQLYRNEKYGFSIKIPKNWILTEKGESIGNFESPDNGAVIMLSYSYNAVGATATTEEAIQQLRQGSYKIGTIQSEENRTINGIPVYIVEVLMSNINLKMKTAYFLPQNYGTFIIAYGGTTDNVYKYYMNDFIDSINSFQLIK